MRVIPRQDSVGLGRTAGNQIVAADDETFQTNVDILGTFPAAAAMEIWKPYEFMFDGPVTKQYFGLRQPAVEFMSVTELEVLAADLPAPISISTDVPDWSNGFVRVRWQVPVVDQCISGCVERAVSPLGPFARVSDWGDAVAGGSFTDTSMAVGVRYFYRVRAVCAGIPHVGRKFCSAAVEGCRSRRLDRDWNDLTHLREGVTQIKCFSYVRDENGYSNADSPTAIALAFDGDVGTTPEASTYVSNNACRVKNILVGIDLGSPHRISGVIAYPRAQQIARLERNALFGANAEHMTDADQLSDVYSTIKPQYGVYNYMAASPEYADRTYRYVYLLSPGDYATETFANISELGFFGSSWQDVVDSGVLVPPASVMAAGTAQNVTVSWAEGAAVESYAVERRVADGEWMVVAELPPTALAFTDYAAPEGVSLEYRVTAHGADDAYAYSYVTASIVPGPGTAQVPPVEIVRSEDLSSLAAVVSWSGSCGTYVHDGTLQRSVSPNGPFTDLATLDHPVASLTVTDSTAVAGVPYYYRVRFVCDDPLAAGLGEVASAPVRFIRARRLERDESDLTTLREGVTAIPPFRYLGTEADGEFSGAAGGPNDRRVYRVFDNDTASYCEMKYVLPGRTEAEWGYQYRALNGAIGVDLGSACHVIGVNAHPRQDGSADRLGPHAIWGGSDSYDSNTWTRISQTYNEKYGSVSKTDYHWYYMPSDDSETVYRYVFLWGVGPLGIFVGTYCNVAEMAIYGWSENDVADSGILIPPTEFTVTATETSAILNWNEGCNVGNYRVECRKKGEADWTLLATLGPDVQTYSDSGAIRKGVFEYRLTAVAEGQDDMPLPVVEAELHFKGGLMLLFR